MREIIQCLLDWLGSNPSDDKPHRVLRVLAKESIKVASYADEEMRHFTASDLVAAAQETPAESNNKWIDWRRSIQPYWEIREPQIIKFAEKRGLKCYPKPERISTKGGRGKETIYLIKAIPLPEISDSEEEQNAELVAIPAQNKNRTDIQYEIVENGEVKPAWGSKWLLHDGQIRLSSQHISVIIGCLCMLWLGAVVLSYFSWVTLSAPKPITTRELTMFLSVFVFPYIIWVFVIKPWMRLFEDRIVRAPELLVDIKEKPSQLELFRDGDLRLIRLVRYSAPCSICGATIYLDEGSPDYPRRMVGRCSESPSTTVVDYFSPCVVGNGRHGQRLDGVFAIATS